MPHDSRVVEALFAITHRPPLISADWLSLVEARKADIMDNIKDFGQMKLGDVEHWVDRGNLSTRVADSSPEVRNLSPMGSATPNFLLSIRGVFIFDRNSYEISTHGEVRQLVYGFTRKSKWVVATIRFQLKDGLETNKVVVLKHADFAELVYEYHIAPHRVFGALGDIIRKHAENRKRLFEKAEKMWRRAQQEDEFVSFFAQAR